jgi:thiosulfate/3-mercaptopyruvate sulfurtransferase
MTLVSTQELDNGLSSNVKLIDASWHFLSNRNGFEEYQKEHIENAIFFDLEKFTSQSFSSREKKLGKSSFKNGNLE